MVTELAHVCFITSDLDRAIAFYRDTLGLQPAFEFTNEQGERYGVYLHIGGRSFLELFSGAAQELPGLSTFRHICLEVDDIRKTVADLQAKGVEVSDISLGCDQTWQAWLSDPDGNSIELHCYTPESWQAPALK